MDNNDFHSLFSFGYFEVFLFYSISFLLGYVFFKIKNFVFSKKSTFLHIIFFFFFVIIGTVYMIIFHDGEKSSIGRYLIDLGSKNENFITFGSLFFLVYIVYVYSICKVSNKK